MAAWQESLNQHTLDSRSITKLESALAWLYIFASKVVGAEGARALAEALRSEACTLHTLHLYADVGEDGVRTLAEALRSEACTLHTLNLDDNGVGPTERGRLRRRSRARPARCTRSTSGPTM